MSCIKKMNKESVFTQYFANFKSHNITKALLFIPFEQLKTTQSKLRLRCFKYNQ